MLNVEKRTNLMDNAHELVYLKPGNISGVYIKFNFMKKRTKFTSDLSISYIC